MLVLHSMNHNKSHINQSKLHFTQWSNKGYAAFCSIGKVVHISSLAVSLTQWIGTVIEHIEDILQVCAEKETDDELEITPEQELLQLIQVTVNSPIAYAKSVIISINNIISR